MALMDAIKNPVAVFRQARKDYQLGRMIREITELEQGQERKMIDEQVIEGQDVPKEVHQPPSTTGCMSLLSPTRSHDCPSRGSCASNKTNDVTSCHHWVINNESNWRTTLVLEERDLGAPSRGANTSSPPVREVWKYDSTAKYPSCLKKVFDDEESDNLRMTWVLEVKDLLAMVWPTELVPTEDGSRGGKWVRKPCKQWPFTPDGRFQPCVLEEDEDSGQDDLMFWLGKA